MNEESLSTRIKEEISAQLGQFLILNDRMPERVEVLVRYGQTDARIKINLGQITRDIETAEREGIRRG